MPAALGAGEGAGEEAGDDNDDEEEGVGADVDGGGGPAADAAPVLSDGVDEVLGAGRGGGSGGGSGVEKDVLALLDSLSGKPVLEAALAGACVCTYTCAHIHLPGHTSRY